MFFLSKSKKPFQCQAAGQWEKTWAGTHVFSYTNVHMHSYTHTGTFSGRSLTSRLKGKFGVWVFFLLLLLFSIEFELLYFQISIEQSPTKDTEIFVNKAFWHSGTFNLSILHLVLLLEYLYFQFYSSVLWCMPIVIKLVKLIMLRVCSNRRKSFPSGSEGKASACNAGDLGSIPWRRKWQPTLAILPGKSHGRRSLTEGYSPWGHKESDTSERLHFNPLTTQLLLSTNVPTS